MMEVNILGNELRQLRKAAGESIAQTADALNIDRSHLNKMELGTYKPSLDILGLLLAHFSVEGSKARQLRNLVKEPPVERVVTNADKERITLEMPVNSPDLQTTNVTIDPIKTPVLFTDSTFVHTSAYGLTLDIAQQMPGNQHTVVTRVGMSFDHAKKLIELMHDEMEKNER